MKMTATRKKNIENIKNEYDPKSAWLEYDNLTTKDKLKFIEDIVEQVDARTKFIRVPLLKNKTKSAIYLKFFNDCRSSPKKVIKQEAK